MDQIGNQPKTIGERLKDFADTRRAQENGQGETKRPTHNVSVASEQVFENGKIIEQLESEIAMPLVAKDEVLLTSSEAAKLLGYTEKSFRNSVALGKVPHYKLFGQNRFKKSELLGLLVRVVAK